MKITYRKSMWEIVTVMKTEPCDTLQNAKPTKENLVQIMTSKRRKHAVCEENSNGEFRREKRDKIRRSIYLRVKSHKRNKIC